MPQGSALGRVFDGKYRILSHLADGGMGSVYEAEHIALGKRVAVKLLHPQVAANDQMVERFRQEARAAAAVGHEGIVEVWDLGRTDDEGLYLVMELLRGVSLAGLVASESRLSQARAVRIALGTLSALAAAHSHGIVHRDLKPENLFLIQRGAEREFVKVLDFGVAKILTAEAPVAMAQTGYVLGTPHYMSPEQARGLSVDHRADLYAVGAILYRLLTGRLPYEAPNFNALLFAIADGRAPRAAAIVPELAPELDAVIAQAMHVDPQRRFPSAKAFEFALTSALPASELALPRNLPLTVPKGEEADTLSQRKRAPNTDHVSTMIEAGTPTPTSERDPDEIATLEGETHDRLAHYRRPARQGWALAFVLGALLGVGLGLAWIFLGGSRNGAEKRTPRLIQGGTSSGVGGTDRATGTP